MVRNNHTDDILSKVELIKKTAAILTAELGRQPNQAEIQRYINKAMNKKMTRKDILAVLSFNEEGGIYQ